MSTKLSENTNETPTEDGDQPVVNTKNHPSDIVSIHLEEDEMRCLESSIHIDGDLSSRGETVNTEAAEPLINDHGEGVSGELDSARKMVSPMSSKNSSGLFCRICHDGDYDSEPLISPCACSGSVGLVHRACIEKWLSTVNQDTCEICRKKYLVSRQNRPFTSWLLTPAVGDDQRNLLGDTVCFLLLTPLTSISAYLCASGAAFYFKVKKSEAIGLICLASLLVFIYLIWLMLTIRYHCQVWFKWRLNNQDIRLLDVSTNRPNAGCKRTPKSPVAKQRVESHQTDQAVVPVNAKESTHPGSSCKDATERPVSGNHVEIVVEDDSSDSCPTDDHSRSAAKKVLFQDNKSYETSTPDQAPRTASLNPVENDEISRITPLSPIVISNDPQADTASVVVSSTEDSDIYAQLPRPRSSLVPAYPCPWMPEMRSAVLSIGSGAKLGAVKSRGTFSPNPKIIKTPFSNNKSNQAYEKL